MMADPRQDGHRTAQGAFVALFIWLVTSSMAIAGALLGFSSFARANPLREQAKTLSEALANWDGRWYASVVEERYSFTTDRQSNVAFFPVYPLAARSVRAATGLSTNAALLVVAYACSLASFVVATAYVSRRYAMASEVTALRGPAEGWVLAAMGFFPTTFFSRMAYSESTFLLLVVLTLYAIAKRWEPIGVAIIVGLATAVRPVGVVLLLPFVRYVWDQGATMRAKVLGLAGITPLALK